MASILILALLIGWNSEQCGTDTECMKHCLQYGGTHCEDPFLADNTGEAP